MVSRVRGIVRCSEASACFFDQTNRLFDPTIIDALESAGYDKSMDEIRAHGVALPRGTTLAVVREFSSIQLDDTARAIWLPQGMRLDLGGIAKGWIAEHAARTLAEFADACAVDAGGDIYMIGLPVSRLGRSRSKTRATKKVCSVFCASVRAQWQLLRSPSGVGSRAIACSII